MGLGLRLELKLGWVGVGGGDGDGDMGLVIVRVNVGVRGGVVLGTMLEEVAYAVGSPMSSATCAGFGAGLG